MSAFFTLLVAGLLVIGSLFALAAVIGILRLPDFYTRMHAASKAGTVGSGVMLIALGIHADDGAVLARAIAGAVFFLLTAPISAHLLAKAAYTVGYRLGRESVCDDMADMKPVDDSSS